jgi:hypothetical protein
MAETQAVRHFYRVHDNGWVGVVTQRADGVFSATVAREDQHGRVRTAPDLASAKGLADAAVPITHRCSSGCSAWFEVSDPSSSVDFTTACPKHHSRSLSFTVADVLFRLNTLSFWCLQCGRAWPTTDEQREHLLRRVLQAR